MKERLMNGRETIWYLMKFLYTLFAFPCLLLLGIGFFFMTISITNSYNPSVEDIYGSLFFSLLIWAGILIPVGFWAWGNHSRRKQLKDITRILKSPEYFWPTDLYHEVCHANGTYFGIDTKNGTMLYVRRIRRGTVDVLGLTLADLTRRRVEGKSKLQLYTKFTDLPCIEVSTAYAQRYFDIIGAMENKTYRTPLPFSEYVDDHIMNIERDCQVHRLAVS